MRALILIPLAAAMLAGCSSGGGSSSHDYKTVQEVRDALAKANMECSGYEPNKEVIGAREDGDCNIQGENVSITIYQSADQRAQIRKAFAALESGVAVDGPTWSLSTTNQDLAKRVQGALGGKLT